MNRPGARFDGSSSDSVESWQADQQKVSASVEFLARRDASVHLSDLVFVRKLGEGAFAYVDLYQCRASAPPGFVDSFTATTPRQRVVLPPIGRGLTPTLAGDDSLGGHERAVSPRYGDVRPPAAARPPAAGSVGMRPPPPPEAASSSRLVPDHQLDHLLPEVAPTVKLPRGGLPPPPPPIDTPSRDTTPLPPSRPLPGADTIEMPLSTPKTMAPAGLTPDDEGTTVSSSTTTTGDSSADTPYGPLVALKRMKTKLVCPTTALEFKPQPHNRARIQAPTTSGLELTLERAASEIAL